MSKITEVEATLLRIEPTKFQQFGDDYLYYAEPGFPDIQRFGTQKGKVKTKKGHPDSYYRATDGKYVFIEYTTMANDKSGEALVAKIKKDVRDCCNEKKTKVPQEQIERIIYCCNSNLSPSLETEVEDFARSEGIPLAIADIKTLDTLSRDVVNRFPWLAIQLELKIDTEQLLPIRTFIQQYQASVFATPLTIPMAGRELELENLQKAITTFPVTVVTGPSGTGKTRLVLEVLEQLQQKGNEVVFCLSDKQRPIYDDLRTYLVGAGPYFLFLDDSNYQIEFVQHILCLLKERPGLVHVVITTRNTALAQVQDVCKEHASTTTVIEKLDDDTIRLILRSKPFSITHRFAIDQILSIADGNPRLAVMAAQLAEGDKSLERLLDVSQLYHQYFDRLIKKSVQEDGTMLRVLGLCSLFRTIDLGDIDFCTRLMTVVGLDISIFTETCRQLARLDLLEADFTGTTFRISEQTLGAYFFYRTVIEEPLLDAGALLLAFFPSHLDRFQEMITGAYNTFGQEKGIGKLLPAMSVYWGTIKNDEFLALKYLDAFWYCHIDSLLLFVERKIEQMDTPSEPRFEYSSEITSSRSGFGDPWLGLLANGYAYDLPEIGEFINFSLAYVRKAPNEYPRLLANWKQAFPLHYDDEASDFHRQHVLIDTLIERSAEGEFAVRTFLNITPTLLRTNGQRSTWGRKRDSMRISRIEFPLSRALTALREKIWRFISRLSPVYGDYIRQFIEDYPANVLEANSEIVAYDNGYLLPLHQKLFSSDNFGDCCVVQDWIKTLLRLGITGSEIDTVQRWFSNPTYQLYQRLHSDLLDGIAQHELPYDIQVFYRLKEQEIRTACTFSTTEAFKAFFDEYRIIWEWEQQHKLSWVQPALDIAIEEMVKRGKRGLAAVQLIIDADNPTRYVPYRPINWLVEQGFWDAFDDLYALTKSANVPRQSQWIEQLVAAIPIERLVVGNIDDLVDAYGQPGRTGYAADLDWTRFVAIDPAAPTRLLRAIETANRDKKSEIKLLPQWLAKLIDNWTGDWAVLQASYLQQVMLTRNFDANFWVLGKIVGQQPGFLAQYVETSTKDWRSVRDQQGLGTLWSLPTAEQAMQEAFDYGLTDERYFPTRRFYPDLFSRVPAQEEDRAFVFLCQYLATNKDSVERADVVLECIREGLPDRWEAIIHYLLEVQPEPSFFERLHWTRDHYTFGRGGIVSEMKAAEFRTLIGILERTPGKRYRYADHRAFLLSEIDKWEKRAAQERKTRFLNDDL